MSTATCERCGTTVQLNIAGVANCSGCGARVGELSEVDRSRPVADRVAGHEFTGVVRGILLAAGAATGGLCIALGLYLAVGAAGTGNAAIAGLGVMAGLVPIVPGVAILLLTGIYSRLSARPR